MKTKNIQKYLESFAKKVLKQSEIILKSKKGSTNLAGTLRAKVEKEKQGFAVKFYMADYGTFVDKGVSGNQKKRSFTNYKLTNESSPYSYKTKQPPSGALDRWAVRKNVAPRDEGGRFIQRKSLIFLIARKIKRDGIQGISFFQKPLGLEYKKLKKGSLSEFTEDIKSYITTFTR